MTVGRRLSSIRAIALRIGAGTVLATILAAIVASVAYSPGYLYRWAVWQDADVDDHLRFPSRAVAAAPEPFTFAPAPDLEAAAESVLDAMAAAPAVGADAEAFLRETGTQAFIVIRDDTVLYEGYFGDFRRDSIATSFSVAKSYVSALVGIAIAEGYIGSVDEPITNYLPELIGRDPRFSDITVGHLLDMTSGIRYDETGMVNGDDALTYYFDDLRSLAIDRTEIEGPPDSRWHYVNYNPLLLGMILERATGLSVSEYLESRLWTRIGTEFTASWSLDSQDGFEKMESGINARAIDFAKLGRLYLEGGTWDGDRVVPASWVDRSTGAASGNRDTTYPAGFEQSYGTVTHERYWWRVDDGGRRSYSAIGNHGQFVFVDPAKRLIIVRTGERYGVDSFEWIGTFTTIADRLLTAP